MGNFGADALIILIVIGALFFGIFYMLRKFVVPYLNSRKAIRKAKVKLFKLETIVWVSYAVIALSYLFVEEKWILLALLLVLAIVGFNFWQNFVLGLFFRIQNKFSINDLIRFEKYTGIIHQIDKLGIEIKTEDEELVMLSYHQLSKSHLIKRQSKGKLMSAKITLKYQQMNEEMAVGKLKEWIFESPWAISGANNNVIVLEGNFIQTTIYAVDEESLSKLERALKLKFENHLN